MMAKKYYLINLLLILIIAFLVDENYKEWTSPPPAGKETAGSKQKTMLAMSSSPAGKKEMPAPAVFQSVSDKNIFSPDRKEFPVALAKPEIRKPPVRPNLQLFGVAVGPEFRSAMINNPTRRADRGERETITVREGDRVGEYKVATITEDRITLESSGDSFDLLLYDPAKQKKRPAVAPTTTPPPPTPTPPSVSTTSTTPPRLYTPPARKDLPARTMTRPQIPRTSIPSAPARTLPVPGTNEEDDSNDDDAS
jgi:hypothetical protein